MNIVVLDGYTLNPGDLSWDKLGLLGDMKVYDRTPVELIKERAQEAEIVLTNKTPLRAETLRKLPKLRYIGVLATGYDVVDVKEAANRNIVVTNVPTYGTDSVAQYVIALLLELCNHVGVHNRSVKDGEWSASKDFCYWHHPLMELAGKTMGIVGFGRIGMRTARIASAFDMKVIVHTRTMENLAAETNMAWSDLKELLRVSDVISLHCPLTPETQGMINRESLSLMKPTAFLINTARGKLIEEADLADALNDGRLAGAALDVLSIEPPQTGSPLIGAKNCIITPHIAWASQEARTRLLQTAIDNVKAFLGGYPRNMVY